MANFIGTIGLMIIKLPECRFVFGGCPVLSFKVINYIWNNLLENDLGQIVGCNLPLSLSISLKTSSRTPDNSSSFGF